MTDQQNWDRLPAYRRQAQSGLVLRPAMLSKRFGPAGSSLLVMIMLALVACARSTPPGPKEVAAAIEGGVTYLLLDWQEGLRIMIWDDIAYGGHFSSSTSSTTDPLFRQEGSVHSADGRGYEYNLTTSDGLQADFAIDGIPYDLGLGKVFLIQVAGEEKEVQQLDIELSGVIPTNEGAEAFGRETPEIAAFIAQSATAYAQSQGATGIPELDRLVAAILDNDLEARRNLVRYTTAGCATAEGLGGPPKCAPDQPEGTSVAYLPVLGPGEGLAVLPEEIGASLDFPAGALYAAYRRNNDPIRDVYYPPGEYGLFFTSAEAESNSQFVLVHADAEGRIVRLDYLACPVGADGQIIEAAGLTCSPEQVIQREASEVLLAP